MSYTRRGRAAAARRRQERRPRKRAVAPEEEFRQELRKRARALGWACYHTHDSRRSDSGFPDEVMVRPPRCIVAECKVDEAYSKPTPEQIAWLAAFDLCPGVESYLWRPSDWPEIMRVLSHVPQGVQLIEGLGASREASTAPPGRGGRTV